MSKPLKVAVSYPQESEDLQILLYTRGYRWAEGEMRTPLYTRKPNLYLSGNTITYGPRRTFFEEEDYEETTAAFFLGNTLRQRVQEYTP